MIPVVIQVERKVVEHHHHYDQPAPPPPLPDPPAVPAEEKTPPAPPKETVLQDVICAVCGKTFKGLRRARYCTEKCKKEAYRRRKNNRRRTGRQDEDPVAENAGEINF